MTRQTCIKPIIRPVSLVMKQSRTKTSQKRKNDTFSTRVPVIDTPPTMV